MDDNIDRECAPRAVSKFWAICRTLRIIESQHCVIADYTAVGDESIQMAIKHDILVYNTTGTFAPHHDLYIIYNIILAVYAYKSVTDEHQMVVISSSVCPSLSATQFTSGEENPEFRIG